MITYVKKPKPITYRLIGKTSLTDGKVTTPDIVATNRRVNNKRVFKSKSSAMIHIANQLKVIYKNAGII